jgi:hypothetical protein
LKAKVEQIEITSKLPEDPELKELEKKYADVIKKKMTKIIAYSFVGNFTFWLIFFSIGRNFGS